jgi:WD40 repeat protein
MSDAVTLLLRDQQQRWAEGRRVRVEDYLRDRPDLRTDDDALLKLIAHEMVLRRESGEEPTLEEYRQRFPQVADELPPFFDILPAIVPGESIPTRREAPESEPPDVLLPEVAGYEILGELGRGGMGIVCKARHRALERIVALKMMRSGDFATAKERVRFRAEALVAARVQHPNIVQIFEVGEQDGRPFLALELVDGPSLHAVLAGEPQSPREAAALVEVLARAIHHAHLQGVVHRDLKPENVLLSFSRDSQGSALAGALPCGTRLNEAVPKIADFGLAKRLDDVGQTATGALLGTPPYMAPEQARGARDIGPPVDVYALGAILYECVTGRPPFRGATPMETVELVRTCDPVSPRTLRPGLPRDLETICLACLEKEPARRYASAQELADELRRYLDGKPIVRRPLGWWGRTVKYARRHPARTAMIGAMGVAAVSLIVAAGSYAFWQEEVNDLRTLLTNGKKQVKDLSREASDLKKEAADANWSKQRAEYVKAINWASTDIDKNSITEATRLLEDVWPREGQVDLRGFEWYHLWKLCHAERCPCIGPDRQIGIVTLTPDGKTAVSLSMPSRIVTVWDTATGKARPMPRFPEVASLALSPDGDWLALAPVRGPIRVQPLDPRAEPRNFKAAPAALVGPIALSQDEQWLAAATINGTDAAVELWEVASGQRRAITKAQKGNIRAVAFSPDGKALAAGWLDGRLTLWNVPPGQDAEPRFLYQPDPKEKDVAVHAIAFVPGSRLIVIGRQDNSLRLWDPGQKEPTPLAWHTAAVRSLSFSPDGKVLASAGDDALVRLWEVGKDVRPLTEQHRLKGHTRPVYSVCFSQDGRSLASGGADGTVKIWDWQPDAKGELRELEGHTHEVHTAAISRDGAVWLTAAAPPEKKKILIRDSSGGEPRELADDKNIACAALSPDGNWAAAINHGGQLRLWNVKAGRGLWAINVPALAGLPKRLAFAPDGKRLALACPEGRIRLCNIDAARPPEFSDAGLAVPPTEFTGLDFHPDGTRLACSGWWFEQGERVARHHGVWICDLGGTAAPVLLADLRSELRCLVYAPDGALLAWGRHDGEVTVADAATGQTVCTFRHSPGPVTGLAFAADGRTLATAAAEVKLWDRATGEERFTLRTPGSQPTALAFDPRGRWLIAGTKAGPVLVWEAATDAEARARKK